ncbi:MAG: hypothetical protein P8Q36_04775 [Alphaproteobacteria bacterium]|nr:hypothetical protein [Alphaproteobacteria bacterium]
MTPIAHDLCTKALRGGHHLAIAHHQAAILTFDELFHRNSFGKGPGSRDSVKQLCLVSNARCDPDSAGAPVRFDHQRVAKHLCNALRSRIARYHPLSRYRYTDAIKHAQSLVFARRDNVCDRTAAIGHRAIGLTLMDAMAQLQEPPRPAGIDEAPIGYAPSFDLTKQHDHQVIAAARLSNLKEAAQTARQFAIGPTAPDSRHNKKITGRRTGPTPDVSVLIGVTNNQVPVWPRPPNLPMRDILIEQALQFDSQRTDPGSQISLLRSAEHRLDFGTQPAGTAPQDMHLKDREHRRAIHTPHSGKEIGTHGKAH